MTRAEPKLRVLVACSGLGRVRRGFETFAEECFEALSGRHDVDAWLARGAGPAGPRQTVVPSLDRRGRVARALAPLIRAAPGIPGIRAYYFEEISFTLALAPLLMRRRPDVILFSDPHIGTVLHRLRPFLRLRTRLLFSNGAPLPPPYPRFDHVHHTTTDTFEAAREAGEPRERQTLLPYGFAFDAASEPLTPEARTGLREQLALPSDVPVILAVGAVNSFHKRTDYLVREVASLPEPRPHLVLLGDRSVAEPIEALAEELLGPGGATFRTVPSTEVDRYYQASDVFALGSLHEGFGRVYVEAMARGLPCVAHDSPHTRSVFDGHGQLAPLDQPGAGARAIIAALETAGDQQDRQARARYARETFSWETLIGAYVQMLRAGANGGPRRS